MNRSSHVLIGLLVAFTGSSAVAATPRLVCPAKVHLAAGRVAADDLPADTTGTVDAGAIRLTGVSAFDGPPEKGGILMPTSDSRNGARSTWVFSGPLPDGGRWVSCDYADGLVHVAGRVDDRTASCEAVVTKSGSPKIVHAEFTCK